MQEADHLPDDSLRRRSPPNGGSQSPCAGPRCCVRGSAACPCRAAAAPAPSGNSLIGTDALLTRQVPPGRIQGFLFTGQLFVKNAAPITVARLLGARIDPGETRTGRRCTILGRRCRAGCTRYRRHRLITGKKTAPPPGSLAVGVCDVASLINALVDIRPRRGNTQRGSQRKENSRVHRWHRLVQKLD